MRSPLAAAKTDLFNTLLNENSLAAVFSGPREIRTLDLLNAIETRSQLRYGPQQLFFYYLPSHSQRFRSGNYLRYGHPLDRMDLEGFEPSTSSVRLKRAPNCATGPNSVQISRLNILTAHPWNVKHRGGTAVILSMTKTGQKKCGNDRWSKGFCLLFQRDDSTFQPKFHL